MKLLLKFDNHLSFLCRKQLLTSQSCFRLSRLAPKLNTDSIMTEEKSDAGKSVIYQHFSWIRKFTPCFGVNGRQVEILQEPGAFYETLKTEALRAKKRIVLASLYLGTGHLEQDFVNCIYDAVARGSDQKPGAEPGAEAGPRVEILLDYTRGSRGQLSSRTMLLPLVKDFGEERVKVSLYHTPDLRGMRKWLLPEKYNETVGLHHMKIYLFDNTVILSGANLSESYFTNRQDRYVKIRDCAPLADFCHRLVSGVSSLSFRLQPCGDAQLAPGLDSHPFEDADGGWTYKALARDAIEEVLNAKPDADLGSRIGSCDTASAAGVINSGSGSSPNTGSHDKNVIDTWIYPLVQMGPFGITVDKQVTEELFRSGPRGANIHLASGYFNLTSRYMENIVSESQADYDILTAAPEANGFYGAQGILGAIPDAYTYIAKQFQSQLCTTCQAGRIRLHEYSRPGWTFHGKGLWYSLPGHNKPCMTLIGSPNFGDRSVYRDLEAQVAIATENPTLRDSLRNEQESLYNLSSPVTKQTFEKPERHIPLWVTYVTPIIRSYF